MGNSFASASSTAHLTKLRPAPAGLPALHHPSDSLTTSANPAGKHGDARSHYLQFKDRLPGPIVGKSAFVPPSLVQHLLRKKRNSALATKYLPGHAITNMEGALHTFLTPLVPIEMVGDYAHRNRHSVLIFPSSAGGEQQIRRCVLSAAIHPDFEDFDVGHALYGLRQHAVEGIAELPPDFAIPSPEVKEDDRARKCYDDRLRQLLVYHLTSSHSLPSSSNLPCRSWAQDMAADVLRQDLVEQGSPDLLVGQTVSARPAPLSLEMLYNTYVCSIVNELSALEHLCPEGELSPSCRPDPIADLSPNSKGYAYTFDPPSIFAATFSVELMNLLYLHALRTVASANSLPALRIFAFNTYAEPSLLSLVRGALSSQPHVLVLSRAELFSKGGHLNTELEEMRGTTLVVHNNSDAFGQNIETEGSTSLDGAIGVYSSAAAGLHRGRKDLLDAVF